MIDSVPLIQNPNDAQQINASIIAMKKASRELNEKIVKLNSLNSELDKKIALLDSGLNKEIEDRKEAINSLDVSSVGGSGKYISAISETDGKIRATVSDLTSVIESGNNQPATSGGVADAIQGVISLPTDAVLHYSFDEVLDYPDGTADERYLNGNTYGVSLNGNGTVTTDPYVAGDNKIHKSNVNGNANYKSDVSKGYTQGIYRNFSSYGNKIVVIEINAKTSNLLLRIEYRVSQSDNVHYLYPNGRNIPLGRNKIIFVVPSKYYFYNLAFYAQEVDRGEYTEWELLNWYIGNGSYSTPIIDNANGQNNATNNGGIATKGLSGKGAYFLQGKYASLGSLYKLNDNFSVSLWVNPDNATSGLYGNLLLRWNYFILRNGDTGSASVRVYLYFSDGTNIIRVIYNSLLPAKTWSHLVVTRDGTQLKGYINGSLVMSETISNLSLSSTAQSEMTLGSNINTRPQSIDDLLIFDRALSDTEVLALYQNKANTPKYYSWADWKLNQMENANRSIVAETRNIEEPPIEESGEEER